MDTFAPEKENQPLTNLHTAGWQDGKVDGLELLLKVAQDESRKANSALQLQQQQLQQHQHHPSTTARPKSKIPGMILAGSYSTPVIVGRGSQATLNLGRINKQVSRRHAVVEWNPRIAKFQITVLGQNGVRVNSTGYPSGQRAALMDGDIVDLVGVKMVFRAPADSLPISASALPETRPVSPPAGSLDFGHDYSDNGLAPCTPKKKQGMSDVFVNHQLVTPTKSSDPYSDAMLSSPTPFTPTARMRHKLQSYEVSPNRHMMDSPPPSSDITDCVPSSPVKSSRLYMVSSPVKLSEASPVRVPLRPLNVSANSNSNITNILGNTSNNIAHSMNVIRNTASTKAVKENSQINHHANSNIEGSLKQKIKKPLGERSENSLPSSNSIKDAKARSEKHEKPKTKHSGAVIHEKKFVHKSIEKTQSKTSAHSKSSTSSTAQSETMAKKTLTSLPVKEKAQKKDHTSGVEAKEKSTEKTSKTLTLEAADKEKTIKDVSAVKEKSKDGLVESKQASDPAEFADDSLNVSSRQTDYTEMMIDTLVFARKKKSMTLSELYDEIMASQPSLMASQDPEEFKQELLQCLTAAKCVGKITRKGKDAYNKPLENQWYYISELDHNMMRKLTRQEVMPSARKCTLKDKQYFFKMPPKLPYHRKSTSPYAVKGSGPSPSSSSSSLAARKPSKLMVEQEDELDSTSASSDEVDDTTTHQTLVRKRKIGSGEQHHSATEKKSKVVAPNKESEEEEEEDDHNQDSLDDLSELSGLSD